MRIQFIAALLAVVGMVGCGKASSERADAATTKSVAQLPIPFSTLKLGMTQAELEAAFPPAEDISKCEDHLVGGDAPLPPEVPGADKKAHAQCARSVDVGGLTFGEVSAVAGRGLRMELEPAPRPQADARWFQERPRIVREKARRTQRRSALRSETHPRPFG
jgi:hypothetical protein